MIFYNWLKIIHILSAALLFGTGVGTALFMYFAHRTKQVDVIALAYKYVVRADWLFTTTSGIVQLATGLLMVFYIKFPFTAFWIWGSLMGYAIAGICWLPVVFLQMRLRDIAYHAWQNSTELPLQYKNYFRIWFWLGWPAFLSLILVFYLMTNRPISLFIL